IDHDLADLIEHTMARDPKDRPATTELAHHLRQLTHEHTGAREPTGELPAEGPGPMSAPAEFPEELTSFVGRRSELTAVRNALGTSRLVTLAGIGGVGKTRLALHTAASVRRNYPDGVWLVELGEVRSASVVVDVVATTLGVRDYAGRSLTEALVDALAPRTTLLVVDNCEQVIDAVAELFQVLLARCPDLHVLTTSREPLGLGGETVIRVSPLTTPDPEAAPSLRSATRSDAVALFAERAAAAVPGFELTESNTAVVAQICERLDGLPLAIELAAARLRALSPEQILERLTDRYKLLTRGSRDSPQRQQTLRWSIGWSYELCTPDEQQLWRELSLFAGGFDVDDVEHVCSDTGGQDLLDTLAALVDKSVVLRDDAGGQSCFRLLDTVREFGRVKLEDTDAGADLRLRHRDWYRRLVRDAAADWIGPRQLEWIARVRRELPNLRQAFEFALAREDGSALLIATALYPFWMARGFFAEGRRWLARALEQPHPQPPVLRARALYAAAILAGFQGDLVAADARTVEARSLDGPSADPATHAFVAITDGITAFFGGELDRARIRLADAVNAPGVSGEPQLRLEALSLLGWAHVGDGTDLSLKYQSRALNLAQEYGEFVHRGYSLWANGVDLWRAGEPNRAVLLLEEGLRLTRRTDDPLMVFTCLQALAWVAAGQGHARRAAIIMGSAEAHQRLIGSNPVLFPNLLVYQEQFDATVRASLDAATLAEAQREGSVMTTGSAIAHALGERATVPSASAAKAQTKLTKRELQVAELIAEGLTNKAIAGRLVISQRTAEGHVDHILTKLDFTSRAQVAAWVVEQQSTTPPGDPTA
ncbi:ATP-binding protein, partial [Speluncibacter jeojiensis]|nr:LuxR C-terminal-related transcriptional regulator [Corynebacteriales bacterium D3-21]